MPLHAVFHETDASALNSPQNDEPGAMIGWARKGFADCIRIMSINDLEIYLEAPEFVPQRRHGCDFAGRAETCRLLWSIRTVRLTSWR